MALFFKRERKESFVLVKQLIQGSRTYWWLFVQKALESTLHCQLKGWWLMNSLIKACGMMCDKAFLQAYSLYAPCTVPILDLFLPMPLFLFQASCNHLRPLTLNYGLSCSKYDFFEITSYFE